jgi:hypothetical protein
MLNSFQIKRAARVSRFRELSAKAESEGNASFQRARDITSLIPFGQPILIGHHSERRHRADIKRSDSAMARGCANLSKSRYYADKAEAAESNNAIFTEDPEAVIKLQTKIAALEKKQRFMVSANKALKKNTPAAYASLGLSAEQIAKLKAPDFCGRMGFPSYALSNNSANIRRLKKRLASVQVKANTPTSEQVINDVRIVENTEDNRCQLFFPSKPAASVRAYLKSHGFRWSRFNGCWQRHRSTRATCLAAEAAKLSTSEAI